VRRHQSGDGIQRAASESRDARRDAGSASTETMLVVGLGVLLVVVLIALLYVVFNG
jgi:hypothetical protein